MSKKDSVAVAAQFFVSRAPRPVILEVEVAASKIDGFVKEYNNWTGEDQDWSNISADGHALDMEARKWGVEARIYFGGDSVVENQMRRYGCTIGSGDIRVPGHRRVNNKQLFKELVSVHGFRIGYNY